LGEGDRHLLQAEHGIARVGRQDLARVLDGKDRNAAGDRNGIADRARRHLAKSGGERRRQLLGPDPAEVAANRGRRSFRILAGIAGERGAVLQLLENLVRVLERLVLGIGRRRQEYLPTRYSSVPLAAFIRSSTAFTSSSPTLTPLS